MDQKLDNTQYLISNQQELQLSKQRQQIQQQQMHNQMNQQMSYVKVEPAEGVLGSPINHPSFHQFKSQALSKTNDFQNQNQFQHTQQHMQNYGQQMQYHFDFQRQYADHHDQQTQNQVQLKSHQLPYQASNFISSQPYHFQTQLQPQLRTNIPATPANNVLHNRAVAADSNISSAKSPIPSRSGTPVDNVTKNEPSQPQQSRKRARKSDHAVPGDEGDLGLKQLAFRASGLPLSELALRIKSMENDDTTSDNKCIGNKENGKERQRQIFGMVWLLNSCESSPTAVVPRNRIYARYVQICADNSLTPLSPASFGKLVRILFPNLTTRRLGMRGQSKYHYCGIKLVGDQNYQSGQSPVLASSSTFGLDSPQSLHNPNTPSLAGSPGMHSNLSTPSTSLLLSEQLQVHNLKYISNIFSLVDHSLSMENMNTPLNIPSIYPYLPRDTDYDIADTLYSLYKVHCTSIFESLRFMHIKKLFSSFASFNTILTAPVFKLYTSDSVLGWVKECDSVMYSTMVKMLAKLNLQNVPDEVLQQLKQVSNQYVDRLSVSLQSKVPKNFILMKLKGAKQFIIILSRLIKVIETGHSASRILSNNNETQSMIDDWMKLGIDEIVLREVPCSKGNVESLLKILNNDFLILLNQFCNNSGNNSDNNDTNTNNSGNNKELSVLNNAANFIADLPSKFSKVNPRLFILVTSNLLTTCLREISLAGGQGFGAWWIVRCWADEYLSWCFELGGFLQDEFQTFDTSELETSNKDISTNTNNSQVYYTNEQLRSASIVDLLDGVYGSDSIKDENNTNDLLLNYDNIGVENILERNNNILD